MQILALSAVDLILILGLIGKLVNQPNYLISKLLFPVFQFSYFILQLIIVNLHFIWELFILSFLSYLFLAWIWVDDHKFITVFAKNDSLHEFYQVCRSRSRFFLWLHPRIYFIFKLVDTIWCEEYFYGVVVITIFFLFILFPNLQTYTFWLCHRSLVVPHSDLYFLI